MEEESILKKMERLFKMRRLLKEKKLKRIKDKKLKTAAGTLMTRTTTMIMRMSCFPGRN